MPGKRMRGSQPPRGALQRPPAGEPYFHGPERRQQLPQASSACLASDRLRAVGFGPSKTHLASPLFPPRPPLVRWRLPLCPLPVGLAASPCLRVVTAVTTASVPGHVGRSASLLFSRI